MLKVQSECVVAAVVLLITAVVYNDCGDFPRYTSPVASACSTGKPDMSFAENNVPVKSSSTENSVPTSPMTLNAVDPLCSTTTPVFGAADADVEPDAIKVGVGVPAPSNVVTLVLNEALGAPNAPLISVAICAEPDNTPAGNEVRYEAVAAVNVDMSVSLVVIRVENEALGAVNDPLMSEAICAELDINVFAVTTSLAVTLIENEADGAVNDPLISDAI